MAIQLFSNNNALAEQISLKWPVVFLILAFTAIPIELRSDFGFNFSYEIGNTNDIFANILGYVPIGVFFGGKGLLKVGIIGALISIFTELCQLAMLHRDASFVDVATNLTGTLLGAFISIRWSIHNLAIRVSQWNALIAVLLIILLVFYVQKLSGDPVNLRGATLPGTLEAQWIDGKYYNENLNSTRYHPGAIGSNDRKHHNSHTNNPPYFDGSNDVRLKHSTVFRLAGSMTITAWIKSSHYPEDDAAIVSQLTKSERGYQLDTTLDSGRRTVGFKLTDACGKLMARYGTKELALDTWYHVAGVYDASAKTLDVYVNGKLDNGLLVGSITSMQRSSRRGILIGSRENYSNKFNFLGEINDVRIYSLALNESQIASVMAGNGIDTSRVLQTSTRIYQCGPLTDNEDKMIPGIAALIGVLTTFAMICIWPTTQLIYLAGISFCSGFLLLSLNLPSLPAFNNWLLPLVSMLGGLCVAISIQRTQQGQY